MVSIQDGAGGGGGRAFPFNEVKISEAIIQPTKEKATIPSFESVPGASLSVQNIPANAEVENRWLQ
jgi:hypothetical protein